MDKTYTFDIHRQTTIRLALNDRLHWLAKLGIAETDPLVVAVKDTLTAMDAVPVMPYVPTPHF